MKVRYSRRTDQAGDVRDYDVRTQDKPRGRWTHRGLVSGFGPSWAALGDSAPAWTSYRATRDKAVADMLAGRTFQDAEGETR
jgi:hypothetical protein